MNLKSTAALLSSAALAAYACSDSSDGNLSKSDAQTAAETAVADAETTETAQTADTDAVTAETAAETTTEAQQQAETAASKPKLAGVPQDIRDAIQRALDARNCTGLKLSIMPATHPLSHIFPWGKSTKSIQGLVLCQTEAKKTQRLAQMGEAPDAKVRTLQTLTDNSPEYNTLDHLTNQEGLGVTQADDLNPNGTLKGKSTRVDLIPKDGDTCEIISYEHPAAVGNWVEKGRTTAGDCIPLIKETTEKLKDAWNKGGTTYGINK